MTTQEALTKLKLCTTLEAFIDTKKEVCSKVMPPYSQGDVSNEDWVTLVDRFRVEFRAKIESEGLVVQVLGKDTYESTARIHEARRLARQQAAELEEIEEDSEGFFSR